MNSCVHSLNSNGHELSISEFKRKQKQLDTEEADARNLQEIAVHIYTSIERIAMLALEVAGNASVAYEQAQPLERRLLNQTIFEKLTHHRRRRRDGGLRAAIR